MLYQGHAIKVQELEHHFVEVCFDLEGESVNKLNQFTLEELRQAIAVIADNTQINGVIFSSAKDVFIVGADITEFTQMFSHSEERIAEHLLSLHDIFNAIEDLHCPTVTAINGIALGGGFELCLSTDFRVMAESAKVGLPEVKLGIYPGWGGTIRLPRLIGVDNANEWICAGSEKRAGQALKEGAVDAVVSLSDLHQAAVDLLLKVAAGDFDYQRRRTEKQKPIPLSQMEQLMAFESAKGVVGAKAGPHYPAPLAALASMQKSVNLPRDKAAQIEVKGFATLAKNAVTKSLVGLFLNDQAVKKMAKRYEALSNSVTQAAVLGAGIMGGGVAYQSASKNIPIFMKDINTSAIQLGLQETSKLLTAQVERGRLKPAQIADVLNRITPALNYGGFSQVDIVVEAVKEDLSIKKSVLAEVEQQLAETAILTSNTSTISINTLASELQRPENFCGMHFFNPVHKMPLVEVIRGSKSSEQAIATTVAYAKSLGKTPIVVNDCPGFFVNRVLFPYFSGFALLMRDGVDFVQVDKIMEQFGWPMGPAYLLDVVGIDTAHHANQVMAAGFPERMQMTDKSVIEYMYEQQRYGQKNKKGFYVYGEDKRGKPLKQLDESNMDYLRQLMGPKVDYTEEDIINRMMIPMCIEVARCLEEGIIDSPAEADMALIYGIGFPPFRGGICHYLDTLGLAQFVNIAASYAHLGPLYQPTDRMQHMAAQNETYFSH